MKSLIVIISQFIFLIGMFALLPPAGAIDAEVRVIPLKHRLAEEVVPLLRPLLAPGESVTGMDSRLIVRVSPRTLSQMEQVLAEVDTPRRNLRISVRHAGLGESSQDQQGISGNVGRSNTRIIVSNGHPNSGAGTITRRGADGGVQLRTQRHSTRTNTSSSQNLTVMDGGHAFLRVGESIPQVQQFLVLVGNRPTVLTGTQYRDVTTGFEVEPRVVGEQIRLAVTPRLAFRGDQGVQTVNFQELRTVVMVKAGEWVDLGGVVESANEVNRQILAMQRHTGRADSSFFIRVDLQ